MSNVASRAETRFKTAFAAEELYGLRLSLRVRLVALTLIATWLVIENTRVPVIYYLAILSIFAVLGAVPVFLRARGIYATWTRYLFPTLDMVLLAFALTYPNPLDIAAYPLPLALRIGNEIYFFVLLTSVLFSYSPRLVLWSGGTAALSWTMAALWIASQPGAYGNFTVPGFAELSPETQIAAIFDPNRVSYLILTKQVLLILIVSGGLATAVWRSRRLVFAHAMAERERGNLARYFSPNLVDELAQTDTPLETARTQDVAVMFVDIVGSTKLSETLKPARLIALLREYQAHLSREVFAHDGTLEKFTGDGLMATFGTPRPGLDDAARAVACCIAVVDAIVDWNETRRAAAQPPITISVGAHFGPVVLGNIGDERRLEFAVLGDTVNVASRLEQQTRHLGTQVVISAALAEEARRQGGTDALASFKPGQPQSLPGRVGQIAIWTLDRSSAGSGKPAEIS